MNTQTIIFCLIAAILFYIILRKNNKIGLKGVIFIGVIIYGGYYLFNETDFVFFEPVIELEPSHGYSTELLSAPYPMSSTSSY